MAKLKIMKKPEPTIEDILAANKHLNFVQRMFQPQTATIQVVGEKYPSTHLMEQSDDIAYPRVVQRPFGQGLHYFENPNDAYNYAKSTGEFIKFKSPEEALDFTRKYKKAKGVKVGQ
jgi:hypothetical protein